MHGLFFSLFLCFFFLSFNLSFFPFTLWRMSVCTVCTVCIVCVCESELADINGECCYLVGEWECSVVFSVFDAGEYGAWSWVRRLFEAFILLSCFFSL